MPWGNAIQPDPDFAPLRCAPRKAYFAHMPGAIHESLRSVIHHALSTNPPTQITFAWAPAYDWELTVWQAPDTRHTKGGITLLIKSRYPDDKHPIS